MHFRRVVQQRCERIVSYVGKNERDLVVLYHDIGVLWPGNRYEKKLVTLVSYGDANGYTAMAKTVGIPTAIAATMILQGKIIVNVWYVCVCKYTRNLRM